MEEELITIESDGNVLEGKGITAFKYVPNSKNYVAYSLGETIPNPKDTSTQLIKLYVTEDGETVNTVQEIDEETWSKLKLVISDMGEAISTNTSDYELHVIPKNLKASKPRKLAIPKQIYTQLVKKHIKPEETEVKEAANMEPKFVDQQTYNEINNTEAQSTDNTQAQSAPSTTEVPNAFGMSLTDTSNQSITPLTENNQAPAAPTVTDTTQVQAQPTEPVSTTPVPTPVATTPTVVAGGSTEVQTQAQPAAPVAEQAAPVAAQPTETVQAAQPVQPVQPVEKVATPTVQAAPVAQSNIIDTTVPAPATPQPVVTPQPAVVEQAAPTVDNEKIKEHVKALYDLTNGNKELIKSEIDKYVPEQTQQVEQTVQTTPVVETTPVAQQPATIDTAVVEATPVATTPAVDQAPAGEVLNQTAFEPQTETLSDRTFTGNTGPIPVVNPDTNAPVAPVESVQTVQAAPVVQPENTQVVSTPVVEQPQPVVESQPAVVNEPQIIEATAPVTPVAEQPAPTVTPASVDTTMTTTVEQTPVQPVQPVAETPVQEQVQTAPVTEAAPVVEQPAPVAEPVAPATTPTTDAAPTVDAPDFSVGSVMDSSLLGGEVTQPTEQKVVSAETQFGQNQYQQTAA